MIEQMRIVSHPNRDSKLHSMCSYMAMFPPAIPRFFIEKYSKKGDLILDPFSGRGTVPLEACLMQRIGIGNDLNPLAFVLTMAKVDVPPKENVLKRLQDLQQGFMKERISIVKEDPNIKMIFSAHTLRQLIFLKKSLNWQSNHVDTFIAAMVLGVMHGGSQGYLSLKMPNTFSMSPGYVRNYIKEHELKKPKREVFDVLLRKLNRMYEEQTVKGIALSEDARNIKTLRNDFVDLILTSPPYTRTISYGKYNWIRLWFLGKDSKEVDKSLLNSGSIEKYIIFMTEFLSECKRLLKPKAYAIIIIGDVLRRDGNTINLAEIIWNKCAKELGFAKVEEIYEDTFDGSRKVSRIWGNKRNTVMKKSDRFLIIQKN